MISLLIPVYNEKENIPRYKTELFPALREIEKKYRVTFEIIFINDGSTDTTLDLLNSLGHIHIWSYPQNRGMGYAVKFGLSFCSGNEVVMLDADLTFRPEDISQLIDKYQKTGADCVSGSPYLKSGLVGEVEPFRSFLSKGVNTISKILLQSDISCISPIFRLYKRRVFEDMVLTSDNFEITAEIMAKLIIMGKRVEEVPVQLLRRRYGSSKIRVFRSIQQYLILFWKIFKVKYLHGEW